MARWSGWGAVPGVFDESQQAWQNTRTQLHELLSDEAYAAARRTTVNAHYTDPAYIGIMWDTLQRLGFDEGEVFEPGCGAGTFIGLAPDGARMTGIELDPTSARVAGALYPDATIRTESIADTRFPADHFDAAVGNVPFADIRLHDTRHNAGGHSLHNHAIIKSLALTRPGGLVAVLSSHHTLDAQNPAARREMNQLADLLGAVRLPSGAHRRAAGSEVLTDLMVFRRREPDQEPASTAWETVTEREVGGEGVRVNAYFDAHPEHVLGEMSVDHGMYGAQTLRVEADLARTPEQLRTALEGIVESAREQGLVGTPRQQEREVSREPVAQAPEGLWDGHLLDQGNEGFAVVHAGTAEPHQVPASQHVELRALLGLRDAARELLEHEAGTAEDTATTDDLRTDLRSRYDGYVQRYGPINWFQLRQTGRVNEDTGEPRMARVTPPVMRHLRTDPFAALVRGLESFDETTQHATPAALLHQRVVAPRAQVLGADTPAEALAVTLDMRGRVDLDDIADLLGQDTTSARQALGELVYHDPNRQELVPAPDYLSGNVREKLDAARAAAENDPDLAVNVTALERVQPEQLGADEIEARMGAAWIGVEDHRAFLVDILGDERLQIEHPGGAMWAVRGNSHTLAATSEWGTERVPAPRIAEAVLEQKTITVTDDDGDGKRILNPRETTAAQEKAAEMQQRFAEWVWEDPTRADRLVDEYNRRFNSIVLRDYDQAGEQLSLPGLASTFTPRAHQRAAVARMISEPAVGLFHEVGAGKTAEMVMGATELQRLGMVRKPAVVVPNHMLEQFSREWLQLYPQARVLAASAHDLTGDKRRDFVARAATNDWDAVILTRSAFERIPVSTQTESRYIDQEVSALRDMLENSRNGQSLTVKRLEKQVMRAEEAMAKKLDTERDPGITFEATGIDYLVVDEMHDYKNLRTVSNIRDAAIDGSNRASDLHMKLDYLRERHGDRVVTAATATPIANSVTEAHVMQRYLRPDLLEHAGVADFDSWAATFGQTVTEMEMAPTGGGSYRQMTRFAKFQNVPEMLRMWHTFADVKTADDLALPKPAIRERDDGQRQAQTVLIDPSPEISDYVADLGERAERVRNRGVDPREDNMLKISTDGRKAALDLRLVTENAATADTTSKLDVAADTIAAIWKDHRDNRYTEPETGEPSPTPGGLQLVFCDLGTPTEERWNAYDELRDELATRGVPADGVRFVHEAKNDTEKARLFAAARAGHVDVLVGSTAKMGVGTNVQARAVALHHIDCPWRPADIDQREGRALRQGNQNAEVGIYRYAVEGSFDSYSWQTVERKAKFIGQIMRGSLDVREMEDIADNALSFAEVKALASGDPLVLEKAEADNDLARLERLERAHGRNQSAIRVRIDRANEQLTAAETHLPQLEEAVAQSVSTKGDAFHATIAGNTYTDRTEAAAALRAWSASHVPPTGARAGAHQLGTLADLGGHTITGRVEPGSLGQPAHVLLSLDGVPRTESHTSLETMHADGLGLIRHLENKVADLPKTIDRTQTEREHATKELDQAHEAVAKPFKHADDLAAARDRVQDITARMHSTNETEHPAPAAEDPGATVRAAFPASPRPDLRPTPHQAQTVPAHTRPNQNRHDHEPER